MSRSGERVKVKQGASLYTTDDPPSSPPVGQLSEDTKGRIKQGPHMGKCYVQLDTGKSYWILNSDIESSWDPPQG